MTNKGDTTVVKRSSITIETMSVTRIRSRTTDAEVAPEPEIGNESDALEETVVREFSIERKGRKWMKKFLFPVAFLMALALTAIGQTTEFSYQGSLKDGANPATGNYDFEFAVFDAENGGTPLGSTLTRSGVSVTAGIFSVKLDFGSIFPGSDRFLEIRVRTAGGGAFTPLTPRQRISSSPYSVKSLSAEAAVTAASATTATAFTGDLAGDVTGTQAATTVARLRGTNVAAIAPTNNQVLKFNSATNQWQPGTDDTSGGGGGGTITGVIVGAGLTGGGTTGSVTVAVANGGVTNTLLADGSVSTAKIADASVTDAKIVGVSGAKVTGAVTNSLQLGGVVANQFVQTGDPRLTDARPPTPGSPNYIQNSLAAQASSNFNVSGVGKAATFDAGTQYNLGGSRILGAFGFQNTVVGLQTGGANMTGLDNTLVGFRAGNSITDGSANIFVGGEAGRLTTTGVQNVFVGDSSGENNVSGSQNSFFGDAAGFNTVGNSGNSFFGRRAGFNNTGAGNSFFGLSAGESNTTGSNNTAFGNGADFGAANLNFTTVIGAGATGNASDSVFLGRAADTVRVPGNLVVTGGLIANLNASSITSGTLPVARGGTGITASGAAGNFLRSNGSAWVSSPIAAADLPTGSGSYIQNSTSVQGASFNISGTGTISGALKAGAVDADIQYRLNGFPIIRTLPGAGNFFVGRSAGVALTTGVENHIFGTSAGRLLSTGDLNSFFGNESGENNSTGSQNAFFGARAGKGNISGFENAIFGSNAGRLATGSRNSFFGYASGQDTTGTQNAFVGNNAGSANTSGSSNTFLGYLSGNTNQTGSNNTVVGSDADVTSASLSFATAIGSQATVNASNTIVLGRSAGQDTVRVPGRSSLNDLVTIIGGSDVSLASGGGYVNVLATSGSSAGRMLIIDDNEIMVRNAGGTTEPLALNAQGGNVHLIQSGTGSVGIGTTTPDQKLSVNGNASKTGGTSWAVFSDERLKNIKGQFTLGLDAIRRLQPIRFEYKADNALGLANAGEQIGFSAQEVQKVIPEAVTTSRDGYLQLNVDPILWAMVNGIKEQDVTITDQQKLIVEMNSRLELQTSQIKEQVKLIAEMKALLCGLKPDPAICKKP